MKTACCWKLIGTGKGSFNIIGFDWPRRTSFEKVEHKPELPIWNFLKHEFARPTESLLGHTGSIIIYASDFRSNDK